MGRAHGHDGSFWVDGATEDLASAPQVTVAGRRREVTRRAGSRERPLLRLAGLGDPRGVRGEPLLVEAELADEEWLAAELVGREVDGLGRVSRVLEGPSCDLLELEDGTLVPLVSDAIRSIGETIAVDREFLGL